MKFGRVRFRIRELVIQNKNSLNNTGLMKKLKLGSSMSKVQPSNSSIHDLNATGLVRLSVRSEGADLVDFTHRESLR